MLASSPLCFISSLDDNCIFKFVNAFLPFHFQFSCTFPLDADIQDNEGYEMYFGVMFFNRESKPSFKDN